MKKTPASLLSVVVPIHNEAAGLAAFHRSIIGVLQAVPHHEIIYVNDGSSDQSAQIISDLCHQDKQVKLVSLARNFGKENALTAGIRQASGDAVITLDGDGQHPVELIPDFVAAWEAGNRVVVGVRKPGRYGTVWKRVQSKLFYMLFNHLSDQKLVPGSTDFRLIDRSVQQAFLELTESNRITRGLIDWLGFERKIIYFTPKPRQHGAAAYNQRKLLLLAMNSFVSLTRLPLFIFGYVGVFITGASFGLGAAVFVEQLLLGDPLRWNFTGTAMLAILIIFLVGIVLMSQGILSLYVSLLQDQSKQRPLYVIDEKSSVGIQKGGHGAS